MPRHAAWFAVAVALAGPGCASLSDYRARSKLLRVELEAYRYPQSQEVVWPEVQRLLADRGLALAGKDALAEGQKSGPLAQWSSAAKETRSTPTGGRVLETGWNQQKVRWRAEAEPDAGGLRVVLTRIDWNPDQMGWDGVTLRDLELELDLLRRVDPEAASRIEERCDPASRTDLRPSASGTGAVSPPR
jgi:hypothetical protein